MVISHPSPVGAPTLADVTTAVAPPAAPRLCADEVWTEVVDDPSPRAIRWASETGRDIFADPRWSKWHWTEGNGLFTACGQAVLLFTADGSPAEGPVAHVNCRRCRAKMARAGVAPA